MTRPVREQPRLPQMTNPQGVVLWARNMLSVLTSLFQEFGFAINQLIDDVDGLRTDHDALRVDHDELGVQDFDTNDTNTTVQNTDVWGDLGVSVTVDVPAGRNVALYVFLSWFPTVTSDQRVVTFRCSQMNSEFSDGNGWFETFFTTINQGVRRHSFALFDNVQSAGSRTYTIDGGINDEEFTVQFISLRAVVVP